jgi:hypothetical protein
MELLQDRVAEVIAWVEEAKTYMEQTQVECTSFFSDDIVAQTVDAPKEKATRAQMQAMELRENDANPLPSKRDA